MVNLLPPHNLIINPIMLPRSLFIFIQKGLMVTTMYENLFKFFGTQNKDPVAHVKRFVQVLIIRLIITQITI